MEGTGKPEYGKAVDIVTKGALSQMIIPALIPVVVPYIGWVLFGTGGARRPVDRHDYHCAFSSPSR